MAFTPDYVPQTELDAVNLMLWSIGQSPVSTLAANIKDVNTARMALHAALRETLTRGYDFNSEEDYPLSPDVNGKINVPTNALKVDPTDTGKDCVERYESSNRRLYNKTDRTFVFTEAVDVDIVWLFPFEEIPQAARAYIATRAARAWQIGSVGSRILYEFTKERENETLAELDRSHAQTADANLFLQDPLANYIAYR